MTFSVGDGVPDRATSGVTSGVGTAPERASLNDAMSLNPGVRRTFIVRVKNPGEAMVSVSSPDSKSEIVMGVIPFEESFIKIVAPSGLVRTESSGFFGHTFFKP